MSDLVHIRKNKLAGRHKLIGEHGVSGGSVLIFEEQDLMFVIHMHGRTTRLYSLFVIVHNRLHFNLTV